ncbi:ribosomal protein S18-alanine N-acetyltransferase [Delftia sp. PS-11]|uniref:ribosomal protein S18-alanine N-acetyltransferase n=1 Tax=Delftia sp. PS-11 TaxID=2767222 RepID=UPI002458D224|nr:ribosomal protein S18-alanine N-acetyltransferase [Delftia sp. PS-11]KAJ8743406.1 ribosomal protein S18-alanine N-acetyltransferase [Delftia sp. PS-11]
MSLHPPQSATPAQAPCGMAGHGHVRFEPLNVLWLDSLLPVEQQAYSHPWTRGNFIDAMAAGYECQLLVNGQGELLGYFVAMAVLDEVHLLNITVAPAHQRQGWARVLLDALALWARQRKAQWIWLEVRESNTRARTIYATHGFGEVGMRKNYYPMHDGPREHAVLMSLQL